MNLLSKVTQYNKSIIALIIALLTVLVNFGFLDAMPDFANEQTLTMLFTALSPILVYAVPNTPPPNKDGEDEAA